MFSYLSQKILAWFDQHGRYDLPWQQNKTPYRVWVSEIMLQQTQVKTAIPYYQRFIQRFPDIASLADAPLDTVLHLWSGLGYYSRARNMHLAAKKIMIDFNGQFPKKLTEVQALPGIGRSTAGAILSIAFQVPTAILDGNVKRVLARLHGIKGAIKEKKTETQLWDYAETYLPKSRASDYTQAMMDLGATICTRTQPACQQCPLISDCIAYRDNLTHLIPRVTKTKALPVKQTTFIVLQAKSSIFLTKRKPHGIWGGLWCFPEMSDFNEHSLAKYCLSHFKTGLREYKKLPVFRHTFSHYHLDINPILIRFSRQMRQVMEQRDTIWYNLRQPIDLGLPKPVAKILQELSND